jgi:predicted phage terminase large subunit-like protein
MAHARAYNPSKILIEDAGVGTALAAELKNAGFPAISVKPEADKKTRMKIQSAKFEGGLVFLPTHAPWLADYEAELFAFPNARYNGQVDSTAQALACDHSGYDFKVIADGMEKFVSGLVFQQYFRGRIV